METVAESEYINIHLDFIHDLLWTRLLVKVLLQMFFTAVWVWDRTGTILKLHPLHKCESYDTIFDDSSCMTIFDQNFDPSSLRFVVTLTDVNG